MVAGNRERGMNENILIYLFIYISRRRTIVKLKVSWIKRKSLLNSLSEDRQYSVPPPFKESKTCFCFDLDFWFYIQENK